MLRKLIIAVLALVAGCSLVFAQNVIGSGVYGDVKVSGGGGTCSQYTAFIGRTSGTSPTEQSAYQTLICGLVSDSYSGGGSLFSALYKLDIYSTNSRTTALLNLCGNIYNSTEIINGPQAAFTADAGYTGLAASSAIDTGFNPSTAGLQDSASMGVYITNNRTAADSSVIMGVQVGGTYQYIQPLTGTGPSIYYDVNGSSFPNASNTSTRGAWVTTRTGASATALYKNNVSTNLTPSATGTSAAPPNGDIYVLAYNLGGVSNAGLDSVAAAFIGKGLTGADAAQINTRLNAFVSAVSGGTLNVF